MGHSASVPGWSKSPAGTSVASGSTIGGRPSRRSLWGFWNVTASRISPSTCGTEGGTSLRPSLRDGRDGGGEPGVETHRALKRPATLGCRSATGRGASRTGNAAPFGSRRDRSRVAGRFNALPRLLSPAGTQFPSRSQRDRSRVAGRFNALPRLLSPPGTQFPSRSHRDRSKVAGRFNARTRVFLPCPVAERRS